MNPVTAFWGIEVKDRKREGGKKEQREEERALNILFQSASKKMKTPGMIQMKDALP